jgi:hypothetical protein
MDYKNLTNLLEAYSAVYNEELDTEVVSEDNDLSFIDELSDNELDQVMEEIFSEEEVTLQECFEVFDEVLSEARVDMAARAAARKQYMAASEKSAKEARGRAAAKERSERRAERVERIKSSAKRAAEKVKTTVAGAASAAAGGAAEVGRAAKSAASAAKKKVTGKLASAKEKIKGLVKSGRKAAAGGLRKLASKVEPKETEKKSAPVGTSANPRVGQPAKERPALPQAKTKTATVSRRSAAAAKLAKAAAGSGPSGETQQGQPVGTFRSKKSRQEARKREARLTAAESLNLLDLVVADLIKEGYANDIDHAYDLIENMDSEQTYNLVESYIEEETVDVYDIVLEHLIVEGYADTLEQAEAIMVNMSEEWREEILDEMQYTAPPQPAAIVRPAPSKINRAPEKINQQRSKGAGMAAQAALGLGASGAVAASNRRERKKYKM